MERLCLLCHYFIFCIPFYQIVLEEKLERQVQAIRKGVGKETDLINAKRLRGKDPLFEHGTWPSKWRSEMAGPNLKFTNKWVSPQRETDVLCGWILIWRTKWPENPGSWSIWRRRIHPVSQERESRMFPDSLSPKKSLKLWNCLPWLLGYFLFVKIYIPPVTTILCMSLMLSDQSHETHGPMAKTQSRALARTLLEPRIQDQGVCPGSWRGEGENLGSLDPRCGSVFTIFCDWSKL